MNNIDYWQLSRREDYCPLQGYGDYFQVLGAVWACLFGSPMRL